MAAQPHHSIGEVLSLLQAEFSDVTISKIRFLESQGLIAPDRSPSGYRRFYVGDIARLRWILAQQRDSFLPLKEIKKRLNEPGVELELEALTVDMPEVAEPTLFSRRDKPASQPEARAPEPARAPREPSISTGPDTRTRAAVDESETQDAEDDESTEPVDGLSAAEIAETAGIELAVVRELDRLGLIKSIGRIGSAVYDPEALLVANAAAVFGKSGLEPRHMRMYKVSAERQAGLLEQIFSSRLARGGRSMQQARDELNELVKLGEILQRSVLRRSFGESLDD